MDTHHLAHELIVVEITESAMINEENRMREFVASLHDKGFEFSIDDFGSGLSSLSMVADTYVETSNYFVKSPASEDVLVISLCNNLD